MTSNNKRRYSQVDDEATTYESPYFLRSKRYKTATCDAETSTRIIDTNISTISTYKSKVKLLNLPNELLMNIFSYMDFEELATVVRFVSKRCRNLSQNILNTSFMRLDKQFLAIKDMLNCSLQHVTEDMEFKNMCKLLNVLEMVQFHYFIIKSSIWRYTCNQFRPSNLRCMYAGTILDIFYRLCRQFTSAPHQIYTPLVIRDNLPDDVKEVCLQAKKFTLFFDKISELPINKSVFISGSKVIDILDCAFQAKREVLHRKQIGNTLFLKLKYYFSNSWFVALDIQEEICKDWQEQMRLLYMRIRRIVLSHTEMNLEHAQVKRENDLCHNFGHRLRSPINSVYTGFGEVEDKFFFYGVMNRGAYRSKFLNIQPHQDFDDPEGADADTSNLGLTITVSLRCPIQLAPLAALGECHQTSDSEVDDNPMIFKRMRGLFDMQIEFNCSAGDKARLPTNYTSHVTGRK